MQLTGQAAAQAPHPQQRDLSSILIMAFRLFYPCRYLFPHGVPFGGVEADGVDAGCRYEEAYRYVDQEIEPVVRYNHFVSRYRRSHAGDDDASPQQHFDEIFPPRKIDLSAYDCDACDKAGYRQSATHYHGSVGRSPQPQRQQCKGQIQYQDTAYHHLVACDAAYCINQRDEALRKGVDKGVYEYQLCEYYRVAWNLYFIEPHVEYALRLAYDRNNEEKHQETGDARPLENQREEVPVVFLCVELDDLWVYGCGETRDKCRYGLVYLVGNALCCVDGHAIEDVDDNIYALHFGNVGATAEDVPCRERKHLAHEPAVETEAIPALGKPLAAI